MQVRYLFGELRVLRMLNSKFRRFISSTFYLETVPNHMLIDGTVYVYMTVYSGCTAKV